MSDGPECFVENYQTCSICKDIYSYHHPYCSKCYKTFRDDPGGELSVFATSPDEQLRNLATVIYEMKKKREKKKT